MPDQQPARPAIIENRGGKKGKTFAHYTEGEFARLLDFYEIAWEYEPKSFPLCWDAEGQVQEYFSPDFYLPEFDLYVELTTLRQSLVTKKNRKLRRLRELYPDIDIKLFYGKDVRGLLGKYGIAEQPTELARPALLGSERPA